MCHVQLAFVAQCPEHERVFGPRPHRSNMPNIKSAKQRVRTSEAAQARNRANKSRLRTAMKAVLDSTSGDDATPKLRAAVALLDRAATRRLLHPNTASRYKSRLARHVASLK